MKMKTTTPALCFFSALTMLALASPASAEIPTFAYVGLSCSRNDAGAYDYLISFTTQNKLYRNGDTATPAIFVPIFAALSRSLDHGLSTGTQVAPDPSNGEARCGKGDGELSREQASHRRHICWSSCAPQSRTGERLFFPVRPVFDLDQTLPAGTELVFLLLS
jgi:hypothetical protein